MNQLSDSFKETLKNTLFLAKNLNDFHGFLKPKDDYNIIACRSSKELASMYPDVFVFEQFKRFRSYSTQSCFKQIFKEPQKYINQIDFENYWTYQAYSWTNELKHAGKNVFCIDYYLYLRLQSKLIQRKLIFETTKSEELRETLSSSSQKMLTQIMPTFKTSYEALSNIYENDFVITDSYSDGGEGVFRITNSSQYRSAIRKINSPVIRTELFVEDAIPVNQVGCVMSEGQIVKYQPSIQIISNIHGENRLEYSGSDFNSAEFLTPKQSEQLTRITHAIGETLYNLNYRGIFGCDFIVHSNDIHFIEINPRYQASTFILTQSIDNILQTPHYLHIISFMRSHCIEQKGLLNYLDTDNRYIPLPRKSKIKGFYKMYHETHPKMIMPPERVQIESGLEKGHLIFNETPIIKPSYPVQLNLDSIH